MIFCKIILKTETTINNKDYTCIQFFGAFISRLIVIHVSDSVIEFDQTDSVPSETSIASLVII